MQETLGDTYSNHSSGPGGGKDSGVYGDLSSGDQPVNRKTTTHNVPITMLHTSKPSISISVLVEFMNRDPVDSWKAEELPMALLPRKMRAAFKNSVRQTLHFGCHCIAVQGTKSMSFVIASS